MPTYEYECPSCPDIVEAFQSMNDAPLATCPRCGQAGLRRLIGRGAGIIFKGSGFYETDYRRSAAKKEGGEAAPSAAPTTSNSSSGAASPAPSASPAPAAPAKASGS